MVMRNRFSSSAIFAALILSCMWAQGQNARDAFWSASDLISVTPNPAARNRPKAHPASTAPANTTDRAPNKTQEVRQSQVSELVAMNGYGAAPHLVRSAESRLGLRCSIMLRGANKEYSEVSPDAVFHSGDHIRLGFLANEGGYFYVIQQGSSGTWSPIYPPPNATPETSRIEAGKLQIVPGGTKTFAFDQNPGTEKLYVILSRTPIADIDRVVHNLSTGQTTPSPEPQDSGAEVEAKNVITDAFVQRLASRDLNLVDEEKVDDKASASAPANEKAIYVVSKGNAMQDSSQVVLSLQLRHE